MNVPGRIRRYHITLPVALCAATLLFPMTGQTRAAFKCVAADGLIEYRELADKNMTCTPLRATPPPSVDPAAEMEKLQKRVEQIDASDDDARSRNCRRARANADVLRGEKSVIQKNADGKEEVLGKEQRAAALAQTQKDIDYWCN